MIVIVALVVGVALGVGLALWLAHSPVRESPVIPETDRIPVGTIESVGHYRVTRENGSQIEVLHQGGGARAAQLYAYHNPTEVGEVIAFYRGAERCSAKGR